MDGGTPQEQLNDYTLSPSTTPQELAVALGTTYRKIRHFYYSKATNIHYSSFFIKKKNGGSRTINAPSAKLKVLQQRISIFLTKLYKPRPSAKAFLKGESIAKNAKPHVRKKFVFNIDLKDFFSTITFPRIRGLLINPPYNLSPETASVIAHLATVDGVLPQGAPTSPIISNMICSRLDRELQLLARKHFCHYTRYADDITFSFVSPIFFLPPEIVNITRDEETYSHYYATPGNELLSAINSNGFSINPSKTRLQSRHERQTVTGLVVNKKVNIDRRYIRKTSAMIHSIESFGLERANEIFKGINPDSETKIEAHIHGRLLFIYQIKGSNSDCYHKLAVRFNLLPSNYKAPSSRTKIENIDYNKTQIQGISKKCWVIENDEHFAQASGFMLRDNLLLSCAHVFRKSGNFDKCVAYRITEKFKNFNGSLIHIDESRDIAIIQLETPHNEQFEFFNLEENVDPKIGDKISVLGFPNVKAGSTEVNRFWASITNIYPISGVTYAEIDKDIYDGNSGGPVLNSNHHVVGIAAKGADDKTGHNAFIALTEIIKTLGDFNCKNIPLGPP
jgi:RNA-directed DNA polymerase